MFKPHIDPNDIYEYLIDTWPESISTRERVVCVFLNANYRILINEVVFVGGRSSCVMDERIIIKKAIEYGSSSIVIAHNHPSGNPDPSERDLKSCQRILELGRQFDLQITQMILTEDTYNLLSYFEIDPLTKGS